MRSARAKAKFLSDMTGESLESVERWAIVGDLETVTSKVKDYADLGVSYHVFSFPPNGEEEEDYRIFADFVMSKLKGADQAR